VVAAESKGVPESRVSILFVKPDEFTDVKESAFGSEPERVALLGEIQKFTRETAETLLPEAFRLEIKITNIDMAGDYEPWRGPQFLDVRIVKDIYPPRMDLEFRLLDADGKVVKEGRRDLRDLAFMMKLSILPNTDRLRHEKELLRDWLNEELRGLKKKD
jgi:hypothetical protein